MHTSAMCAQVNPARSRRIGFQALQECDLPLLAVLEAAIRDAQQAPRFVLKTVDRPQCMSTHQDFILIIRLALRFAGCSRMLLSG